MVIQDVADTSPFLFGDRGLNPFLVAPLTRDAFTPRPTQTPHSQDTDLMFLLTRSYQTLTYSDGGD